MLPLLMTSCPSGTRMCDATAGGVVVTWPTDPTQIVILTALLLVNLLEFVGYVHARVRTWTASRGGSGGQVDSRPRSSSEE